MSDRPGNKRGRDKASKSERKHKKPKNESKSGGPPTRAKRDPNVTIISVKRKGPLAALSRTYPFGLKQQREPLPFAVPKERSAPDVRFTFESMVDQEMGQVQWQYIDSYLQCAKLFNHILLGIGEIERSAMLSALLTHFELTHVGLASPEQGPGPSPTAVQEAQRLQIGALLRKIATLQPHELKKHLANRGTLFELFSLANVGQSKRDRTGQLSALLASFDNATQERILHRVLRARCAQHPSLSKALKETGTLELREDKRCTGAALGPIYEQIRSELPAGPEESARPDQYEGSVQPEESDAD